MNDNCLTCPHRWSCANAPPSCFRPKPLYPQPFIPYPYNPIPGVYPAPGIYYEPSWIGRDNIYWSDTGTDTPMTGAGTDWEPHPPTTGLGYAGSG